MLFVAEIGLNHDGNFDLAYELIRRAKLAGANIAKFQFGWRCKEGEINQIDADRARQLRQWCDFHEIEMMASIINEDALALADAAGCKRFKIASRTVVDKPHIVKEVLERDAETFISLGFWEGADWPFGAPTDKLRYIYCRSRYPSYPGDMVGLPESFGQPGGFYGYSDHYHGIAACLTAIARGARFVEKHFTLNKTSQVIRDHVLSATPEEFAQLTQLGGEMARLQRVLEAPK